MTVYKHELRSNRITTLIWCGIICAMTMLTMLLYPSFKDQMGSITSIFSAMGPFTAALGLDQLDLGSSIGFYGTESGTMLAVGGTMFAAFLGIGLLAKEEGNRTAEFLLTQPISRTRVVLEKLLAMLTLLVIFNVVSAAVGGLCFLLIGEALPLHDFLLFHAAQLCLHVEIGCVCLALSAFARRTQIGVGLGLSLLLYFLSLIINMVDSIAFLRYITPFSYADASKILSTGTVDGVLLAIGAGVTLISVALAFTRYNRKDIAA